MQKDQFTISYLQNKDIDKIWSLRIVTHSYTWWDQILHAMGLGGPLGVFRDKHKCRKKFQWSKGNRYITVIFFIFGKVNHYFLAKTRILAKLLKTSSVVLLCKGATFIQIPNQYSLLPFKHQCNMPLPPAGYQVCTSLT